MSDPLVSAFARAAAVFARVCALALMLLLPFATHAQESTRQTVLVLDGSGSMWGQIEGEAKITSAQRAVDDLLETMTDESILGLIAYGHRTRGDCADIEVMVEPAPGTRNAVSEAVNSISPRGKTPLGESVRLAAEILRYQEDTATVILLSDGLENCGVDPCALGAELEAAGIDFTAHVIGFDVAAPEDQAQLACIAETTGGRFLAAGNAAELSEALVAVAAPPEPVARSVEFVAIVGEGGPVETEAVAWFISPVTEGMMDTEGVASGPLLAELFPGDYRVEAVRPSDEASSAGTVAITADAPDRVVLVLPERIPDASLSFEGPVEIDSVLPVTWTGPGEPRDYIAAARPGEDGYESFVYIDDGNPAPLVMPAEPGDYEIRYIHRETGRVLAAAPVTVTDLSASLDAPPEATVGTAVDVGWAGPGRERDYVTVAVPGSAPGQYINYAYVDDGSPVSLTMPGSTGRYELRYVLSAGPRVLASMPVDVRNASANVSSAPTVGVGQPLEVTWEGPGGDRDFISIARDGDAGGAYVNYTYAREGSPLTVTAPSEPGAYELRYILDEGRTMLAAQPIVVEDVLAMVASAPTAGVGQPIEVTWDGPGGARDFITVAEPGSDGGAYVNYTYTREGSPLTVTAPSEPGTYELRYILDEGRTILAAQPITIEEVGASIDAPPSAPAGGTAEIGWQGPGGQRDFITIAEPGAAGGAYEAYTYVREGSPLTLAMPADPGDYEVRYILDEGRTILASVPFRVTEVTAELEVPPSATAGARLSVGWTGPGGDRDYVSIALPEQDDGAYKAYTYVREGSPLYLATPVEPGDYEIRYIQDTGRRALARVPISIEDVSAQLGAPDTVTAGGTLQVIWQGPAYQRDYVSIAERGADDGRYESYQYVSQGQTLTLEIPETPGSYELRYVLGAGPRVIARRNVDVE